MADAEAEEKILSELDVQLTNEADAGHVAQKTADCTLHKNKPLPTRNCCEPCLQAGNLQTRGKNKSRSARKNARQKAGGVLVTSIMGGGQTCVPDALCVLIPSLGILTHVEELRSIMSADAEEDTLFTNANGFVKNYGLMLSNVTAQFGTFKGGPALGLLQVMERLFVVQLRITKGNHDKKLDFHCVAYDGCILRNNYRYSKVKIINEEDRNDKDKASTVFDSLFHKLKVQVRIMNVYELKRLSASGSEVDPTSP